MQVHKTAYCNHVSTQWKAGLWLHWLFYSAATNMLSTCFHSPLPAILFRPFFMKQLISELIHLSKGQCDLAHAQRAHIFLTASCHKQRRSTRYINSSLFKELTEASATLGWPEQASPALMKLKCSSISYSCMRTFRSKLKICTCFIVNSTACNHRKIFRS